jgi:hypothetical protein
VLVGVTLNKHFHLPFFPAPINVIVQNDGVFVVFVYLSANKIPRAGDTDVSICLYDYSVSAKWYGLKARSI